MEDPRADVPELDGPDRADTTAGGPAPDSPAGDPPDGAELVPAATGHPLVSALLRDRLGDPGAVERAVHRDDEMLAYLVAAHDGDLDQGLAAYFRTGLAIAETLGRVMAWRPGGLAGVERLLDFASGYGRVTRFLVREVPPQRVWVADLDPEAVRFQERRFGVRGLLSSAEPETFRCGERFDAILVTSLFTHLPRETFGPWLRRLAGLLAPGGLLALSAHDVSLLPPEWDVPEAVPGEGHRFLEVSESRHLSTREYGSAWIDEGFFRRALEAAGDGLVYRRLPRALGSFHDLYVVVADPRAALDDLAFPGDARGYLESCELTAPGAITARGWVADPGGGRRIESVEVTVDGRPAGTTRELQPRPDVAAAVAATAAATASWRCPCPVPSGVPRSEVVLLVKARLEDGSEHVLHLSSLEAALLWSARRRGEELEDAVRRLTARAAGLEAEAAGREHRIAELEARLRAMRASRFWKLRDAWFRLKRTLGLTAQE